MEDFIVSSLLCRVLYCASQSLSSANKSVQDAALCVIPTGSLMSLSMSYLIGKEHNLATLRAKLYASAFFISALQGSLKSRNTEFSQGKL